MSSSSTYNVLLKSPVQPQTATAPKRDYQNESAATDFKQALKDVHDTSLRQKDLRDKSAREQDAHKQSLRDSTRRQDEKLAQANSHKAATQADNRKHAKEISAQKKSVDNAARADKKNAANDISAKDKALISKDTGSKQIKKTGDSAEEVTNSAAAASPVAIPVQTTLPTTLTIASETEGSQEIAPTIEASLDLIAANLASSQSEAGANSLLNAQLAAADSNSDIEVALDGASEDANLVPIALPVEQAPGFLTGAASVVNAAATNPVTAAADVIASLTLDVFGAEKSSSKLTATTISPEVDIDSETAVVATQTADPKSTFEKMLQSVARSGVTTPEESAPVNSAGTANNSNNSSQSNAMDSLLRLSDSQTPAARSFVVQTAVPIPVGQPRWSEAVGEKVLWLAAQNVSAAEINLHPKDLGPIQIKVSVNQEQASVSFTSHHAVVREVLDQNLNRLRDMFNEQGLNLVNVDVSDKSFSRQQGEGKDQKGQGANNAAEDETPIAASAIVQQRLVDHYA